MSTFFKGRLLGLFQHCSRRLIVLLLPNEFLHSSPEAPHTIQGRETSASEGRNYYHRNLASKSGIYESTKFFYMPQSWDMGQILSLPLRRNACWGLFGHPKIPTASVEPATSCSVDINSTAFSVGPGPMSNSNLHDISTVFYVGFSPKILLPSDYFWTSKIRDYFEKKIIFELTRIILIEKVKNILLLFLCIFLMVFS